MNLIRHSKSSQLAPLARLALAQSIALLALSPRFGYGQRPPGVVTEPTAARIMYDDLDRFADVWPRLNAVGDTTALLDSAYLARATPGLRAYARLYDVNAAAIAAAASASPGAFRRAATEAPARLRSLEGDVRNSFIKLAQYYPPAYFPPVFYLVGRDYAGGATQREGLLISVETYAHPLAEARPHDLDDVVHLVAHELTHYQQAAYDVALYTSQQSLLARAIREGTADFVAELISGDHINQRAHAYGMAHERELWARFRCEMHGTDTGDWFFRKPADPEWPQDLGYFIGYRIAQARFKREEDAADGVAALLRVDDYNRFLDRSGYEAEMNDRSDPFPPCGH